MKLTWYGHSCFGMTFSNGTTIITDPFDETVGYPLCTAHCDAALISHEHFDHNHTESLNGSFHRLSAPGHCTIGVIEIMGVASFHDEVQGAKRGNNVIHILEGDGLRIAHLGDLGHFPNAEQTAALQNLDLLMLPIGGTYTITSAAAAQIIATLRPRVAVGMHYQNAYCHFDISDESEFMQLTNAQWADNPLEITAETLKVLPSVLLMRYE